MEKITITREEFANKSSDVFADLITNTLGEDATFKDVIMSTKIVSYIGAKLEEKLFDK